MSKLVCIVVLLLLTTMSLSAQETLVYQTEQFTMDYNDQWELAESDNEIIFSRDTFILRILIDARSTGLPAGDFKRLKFIGQYGLPIDILTYKNKIKQVLYGQLETLENTYTIILDAPIPDGLTYDDIDIPREIVDDASRIVSSLLFHTIEQREVVSTPFFDGQYHQIDTWESYLHPTEKFGFRYPNSWSVTDMPDRVVLDNGLAIFTIGFSTLEGTPPNADVELFLSSSRNIRVPIYAMFQLIESEAITPRDDKALAVIYQVVTTSDNQFLLWVKATSDSLLDPQIMDEVDLIISTFKTTPLQ